MSSIEDVIHFFEMEIEYCKNNNNELFESFNGVCVGLKEAQELNKAHIKYCQNIINRIKRNRL